MFNSRLNAHFAISPLLYDHMATWDSREGLGARSCMQGLLDHVRLNTGPLNSSRFVVSVSLIESLSTFSCCHFSDSAIWPTIKSAMGGSRSFYGISTRLFSLIGIVPFRKFPF